MPYFARCALRNYNHLAPTRPYPGVTTNSRYAHSDQELLWQPPEEYICEIVEMLCVWNVLYCILLEIKLILLLTFSIPVKSAHYRREKQADSFHQRKHTSNISTLQLIAMICVNANTLD